MYLRGGGAEKPRSSEPKSDTTKQQQKRPNRLSYPIEEIVWLAVEEEVWPVGRVSMMPKCLTLAYKHACISEGYA